MLAQDTQTQYNTEKLDFYTDLDGDRTLLLRNSDKNQCASRSIKDVVKRS